jgi:anti-sigma factor RsiW
MEPCLDDTFKLDYLNGTLSEGERALFEKHLAACPECRREIVELRKTAAEVSALTSPVVPAAWTAAAKDRLRAKIPAPVAAVPSSPASARRRANVFQYALVTAGVAAGLALLFGLVLGGTVRGLLPGLSAAGLGISDPSVARTVNLVVGILSLHALLFVPSIIDNIYRLVRRDGRRGRPGSSAGQVAC